MKKVCHSLGPVADGDAIVLILGSMPSEMSLEKKEYYANPLNQFWRIIYAVFGKVPHRSYPDRIAFLKEHQVALWDVLMECSRDSSGDARIGDEVANDLNLFLREHPGIRYVFFNGRKAHDLFDRLMRPQLGDCGLITFIGLPSSSSANAKTSFEIKVKEWMAVKSGLDEMSYR